MPNCYVFLDGKYDLELSKGIIMRYFKNIMLAQIIFLGLCFGSNLSALQEDVCPRPQIRPDELLIESNIQNGDKRVPYVDNTRPIKDLGTDIVVKEFFATKSSLYNFYEIGLYDVG